MLLDLLTHAGDDILHLAFVVAEAVRQRCIPVPELIVLVGGEHQVMVDLPVAIDVLQGILNSNAETTPSLFHLMNCILQALDAGHWSICLGLHQPQLIMPVSIVASFARHSLILHIFFWRCLVGVDAIITDPLIFQGVGVMLHMLCKLFICLLILNANNVALRILIHGNCGCLEARWDSTNFRHSIFGYLFHNLLITGTAGSFHLHINCRG